MTVERVRVGDVLRLVRRPVSPEPHSVYTSIGIRSFGKGVFKYEPKPGGELGSLRHFEVEPGRLIVSNIKGWEGAIAVSNDEHAGCVASNRFLPYEAVDGRIDVNWAKWFFLSDWGLELIGQASPGSADRNRTLAMERFEALEIPLPSLPHQREVAIELDYWWPKSLALIARIASTGPEVLVRGLPALVDAIFQSSAVKNCAIQDLVEFVNDVVHPEDDPSPAETFVGLQHIESHTGRRLGESPLGSESGRKFRFRPGDIVYGYLRPYLNKAWVADRHGLCSVDQYVLRPKPGVDSELVGYLLRSAGVLNRAVQLTHSLQLPRLRSGLLKHVRVSVPDSTDVRALVGRLDRTTDRVLDAAELKRRQTRAAAALHPALMNEYFGLGSSS